MASKLGGTVTLNWQGTYQIYVEHKMFIVHPLAALNAASFGKQNKELMPTLDKLQTEGYKKQTSGHREIYCLFI